MKMKCLNAFSKILPVLEEPELVLLVVDVFQAVFVTIPPGSITQDVSNDLNQLLWPYKEGFWGEPTNLIVTNILKLLPEKVKKEEKSERRKKS
jgi:hypothetical protein